MGSSPLSRTPIPEPFAASCGMDAATPALIARRPRSTVGGQSHPREHFRQDESMTAQIMRSSNRSAGYLAIGKSERRYVDYKRVDDLRRLMTPNGKIYSRKRTGISSGEQRKVAKAIKRARYMALLPYTSATL